MNQLETIAEFVKSANYHLIKFDYDMDEFYGKILVRDELGEINLDTHSVYRSIGYKNGNKLFVHDLKPRHLQKKIKNPLQLLLDNLEEAKIIELVYPKIFRWAYDGISLKAYAIVPSGSPVENSTITRYGGTDMFMMILRQHLENIRKMQKGITPDYDFLKNKEPMPDMELSIGSLNLFNGMYSIGINLSMSYIDIIKSSKVNKQVWEPLNNLKMKFWAREINPDFITEAKHFKLDKYLDVDTEFKYYPLCIRKLSKLEHKGNYKRFLLAKFLLNVHKPHEAKFVYYTILGDEELEHVKKGNCSTQWNYIRNNIKEYDCPTCSEMKASCDRTCKLNHPLEEIQKEIENADKGRDD